MTNTATPQQQPPPSNPRARRFGRAWVFAVLLVAAPAVYWLGAKLGGFEPRFLAQVTYGTVTFVVCTAIYVYGVSRWSPYAAPPQLTGTTPVTMKQLVIAPAPASVNYPALGPAPEPPTTTAPATPTTP